MNPAIICNLFALSCFLTGAFLLAGWGGVLMAFGGAVQFAASIEKVIQRLT